MSRTRFNGKTIMKKGTRVVYVPDNAIGGIASRFAAFGVVKSYCYNNYLIDDNYLFVIYDQDDVKMITGDEPYAAARTNIKELSLITVEYILESMIEIKNISNNGHYVRRLINIIRDYNLLCPEIHLASKLL